MNSTVSTLDSQSVPSTDMEALVVRLQAACISAVEESMYRLGGLELLHKDTVLLLLFMWPQG